MSDRQDGYSGKSNEAEFRTERPQRLVIVEDEYVIAVRIQHLATELGHQIVGVLPSPEGIEAYLQEHDVDVVLMDVYYNTKPLGLKFARRLAVHQVSCILISGVNPAELMQQLGKYRPEGIVYKPVRASELYTRLELLSAPLPLLEVRHRGYVLQLAYTDIVYLESSRNDCYVRTRKQQYVGSNNLAHYTRELSSSGFIRIHRYYLINTSYIEGYTSTTLRLTTGIDLPVGRSYAANLKKELDLR